jgi:hypothetical protein
MDQVRFEARDPDDVIAAGRSRRMRRRVVGATALTLMVILGGTGVAVATSYTMNGSTVAHPNSRPSHRHPSPTQTPSVWTTCVYPSGPVASPTGTPTYSPVASPTGIPSYSPVPSPISCPLPTSGPTGILPTTTPTGVAPGTGPSPQLTPSAG